MMNTKDRAHHEVTKENLQVMVRIRPLNDQEKDDCSRVCIHHDDKTPNTLILDSKPEAKVFAFDHVADESIDQAKIFEIIAQPIAEYALEGYNGCIFAYGQTGAGKTYTMQGLGLDGQNYAENNHRGIIPRVFEEVFSGIAQATQENPDLTYLVKCSYLEIYNEHIIDLLNPQVGSLLLREDLKEGVYVESLTEEETTDVEDCLEILRKGARNRHIGSTSMNIESSRSHSVLTLTIESKLAPGGIVHIRTSRFHLVDLAGSERQKQTNAVGDRLKEGCNINKSLSILGNVINSLVELGEGKARHIHYRDSKLTFLLKDSLGGNSKTSLIANISPASNSYGETLSTLKFAQRAKLIKNNASINEDSTGTLDGLKKEVLHLRQELAEARGTLASYSIAEKKLTRPALQLLSPRVSSPLFSHSPIPTVPNSARKPAIAVDGRAVDVELLMKQTIDILTESEVHLHSELATKEEYVQLITNSVDMYERNELQYRTIIKLLNSRLERAKEQLERHYTSEELKIAGNEDQDSYIKENVSLNEILLNQPTVVRVFLENVEMKERLQRGPTGETRDEQRGLILKQLESNCQYLVGLSKKIDEVIKEKKETTQQPPGALTPENQRRINAQEAEMAALTTKVAELESELLTARQRVCELEVTSESTEKKAGELQSQVAELTAEKEHLHADYAKRLQEVVDKFELLHAEKEKTAADEHESILQSMRIKLLETAEKLAFYQEQHDEMKALTEQLKGQLASENEANEEKIKKLTLTVNETSLVNVTLEGRVADLTKIVSDREVELNLIREDLEKERERSSVFSKNMEEMTSDIARYQEELDTHVTVIKGKDTEISSLLSTIKHLENQVEENKKWKEEYDTLSQTHEFKMSEATQQHAEYLKLKQDHETALSNITQLSTNLDSLIVDVNTLEKDKAVASEQLSELEQKHATLKAEHEQMCTKYTETVEVLEQLKKNHEDVVNTSNQQQEELRTLQEIKSALDTELNVKAHSLADKIKDNEDLKQILTTTLNEKTVLEGRLAVLNEKIIDATKKEEQINEELVATQEEKSDLASRLTGFETKVTALNEDLTKARNQSEETQQKLDTTSAEKTELDRQLTESRLRLEELEEICSKSQEELTNLRSKMTASTEESNKSAAVWENERNLLSNEISQLKDNLEDQWNQVSRVSQEKTELEGTLIALKAAHETTSTELSELQGQLNSTSQSLLETQKELETAISERDTIKISVASLQRELHQLGDEKKLMETTTQQAQLEHEQKLETISSELNEVNAKLLQQGTMIETLESKKEHLELEVQKLTRELENEQTKCEKARSEITVVLDTKSNLEDELVTLMKTKDELQSEIDTLRDENTVLKEKNLGLEEYIGEIRNLEDRLAQTTLSLETVTDSKQLLETQLVDARKETESLQQEVEIVTRLLTQLKNEKNSLEETLQSSRDELESVRGEQLEVNQVHEEFVRKLEETNEEVQHWRQVSEGRDKEVGRLTSILNEMTEKDQENEKEIKLLSSEILELEQRHRELEKRVQDSDQLRGGLAGENSDLRQENIDLEKQVTKFKDLLETLQNQHEKQVEILESRYTNELQNLAEERQHILDQLERQRKVQHDARINLEAELKDRLDEISMIREESIGLKNEINSLEQQNEVQKRQSDTLANEISDKNEMLQEAHCCLTRAKGEFHRQLQEKAHLIAERERELRDKDDIIKDFTNQTKELNRMQERELTTLKATMASLELQHANVKENLAKKTSECDTLRADASKWTNDRDKIQEEAKSLKSNEVRLKKECLELTEKLARMQTDKYLLLKEIDNLNKANEALAGPTSLEQKIRHLTKVKEENTKLKDEKSRLTEDLMKATEAKERLQKKLDEIVSKGVFVASTSEYATKEGFGGKNPEVDKLKNENKLLVEGFLKLHGLIPGHSKVEFTPSSFNNVDHVIRGVQQLVHNINERDRELTIKTREIESRNLKLSIQEKEILLLKQKVQLCEGENGMVTGGGGNLNAFVSTGNLANPTAGSTNGGGRTNFQSMNKYLQSSPSLTKERKDLTPNVGGLARGISQFASNEKLINHQITNGPARQNGRVHQQSQGDTRTKGAFLANNSIEQNVTPIASSNERGGNGPHQHQFNVHAGEQDENVNNPSIPSLIKQIQSGRKNSVGRSTSAMNRYKLS